jgi:hypothetical protein
MRPVQPDLEERVEEQAAACSARRTILELMYLLHSRTQLGERLDLLWVIR